jgi:hypothetical protein
MIDGKYTNNEWTVVITPLEGLPYEIQLDTDDIEWSMKQYQKNRQPLNYEACLKT